MSVQDKSRVDEQVKIMLEMESMHVKVGILSKSDGKMLMIANVHEFGCDIPVTDKMRGFFLHEFGVGLRKSTTVIKIPERSFIRSSFDANREKIYADGEKLIDEVMESNLSARQFYEMLGETCVKVIKDFIVNEVNSPANTGLTVANKGSSNPLVDTGSLVKAVDYEIVGR